MWVVPELLSGPEPSKPRAAATSRPATRSYVIRLTGEPEVAAATPEGVSGAPRVPSAGATAHLNSSQRNAPKQLQTSPGGVATRAPNVGAHTRGTASVARAERAATASPAASHAVTPHPGSGHAAAGHTTARATVSPGSARVRAHATPERQRASARQVSRERKRVSSERWSVQVASFLVRAHAERFERELKARGFRASVSRGRSRGRVWYRVRVGPERDRRAALALARRLRAAGHSGELVRGS